jgi:hypothetical protein
MRCQAPLPAAHWARTRGGAQQREPRTAGLQVTDLLHINQILKGIFSSRYTAITPFIEATGKTLGYILTIGMKSGGNHAL